MYNVMVCIQLENTFTLKWNKELGIKLKKTRQSKSLFRKDLALKTGISYPLLEKLELGTAVSITKDNLFLIANALDVHLSILYPVIEIKT